MLSLDSQLKWNCHHARTIYSVKRREHYRGCERFRVSSNLFAFNRETEHARSLSRDDICATFPVPRADTLSLIPSTQ